MQTNAGNNQQSDLHPDLLRATKGLMLQSSHLQEATGIRDWNSPSGVPRFARLLEEKDKLFVKYRGTAVGTMDWSSNGPDGLFVSDVRFVFESESDCLAYYRSTIANHAELVYQDSSGCYPRMVEVEPGQGYMIGTEPRMFCGPSLPARQRLILSLTSGRSKEDAEHLVRLAEKAVHLLYLFCSGRVMCKLRVTTHNGLTPLGHAHAVAMQCKRVVDQWLASGDERVCGKEELRRALKERALQRQQEKASPQTPSTPSSQRTTPHAVTNAHHHQWAPADPKPPAEGQELCIFAVGEGEVRGAPPVKKQLGRLLGEERRREGKGGEEGVDVRAVGAESEDGKAVQSYAAANRSQKPAPLVLLCPRLTVLVPPELPEPEEEALVQAEQAVGDVVWEWSADAKVASALRGKAGACPEELRRLGDEIHKLSPLQLSARLPSARREDRKPKTASLPSLVAACGAAAVAASRESSEGEESSGSCELEEPDGGGDDGERGLDCLLELARHACMDAEATTHPQDPAQPLEKQLPDQPSLLGKRGWVEEGQPRRVGVRAR